MMKCFEFVFQWWLHNSVRMHWINCTLKHENFLVCNHISVKLLKKLNYLLMIITVITKLSNFLQKIVCEGELKLTRTEKDSLTCSVQVSRPFSRIQVSQALEYSGVLLLMASYLLQIIVKVSEFWNDLFLTQFRAANSNITFLSLICILKFLVEQSYK